MRRIITGTALAASLLAVAAVPAGAVTYPVAPKDGAQSKPKGKFKTLKVCKKGCAYKKPSTAAKAAKAGDTVKIANGSYKDSIRLSGSADRYIQIIGNPKDPGKVVFDATGLKGAAVQNGVRVNGADNVIVDGITAKNFLSNGFFFVNVTGYRANHLVADKSGVYGIYAFNSIGGEMLNSSAFHHNDAGFYIGQTPPQSKPIRSIVRNVSSYENVLGWSGTNMRYVTISKSRFFNNGAGIVPNALDTEQFPPAQDNVIRDNDIFWNNFNYYKGAPFPSKETAVGEIPYPVGIGILLFGAQGTVVEKNRIFGNYLGGFGAIEQVVLKDKDKAKSKDNVVRDNVFGKQGADRNGRDLYYDGNGSRNCFSGNIGVQTRVPADGSTFAACPFTGANAFSEAAQAEGIRWAVDATHEAYWIKYAPHPPIAGITPLEEYKAR
jgi:hypothetical protein